MHNHTSPQSAVPSGNHASPQPAATPSTSSGPPSSSHTRPPVPKAHPDSTSLTRESGGTANTVKEVLPTIRRVRAKANDEVDRLLGVIRQATLTREKALEEEITSLKKDLAQARVELEEQRVLKEKCNNMKLELEKVRGELEEEKAKGKARKDQIDETQSIENLDILMDSDINCGGFEWLEDMLE